MPKLASVKSPLASYLNVPFLKLFVFVGQDIGLKLYNSNQKTLHGGNMEILIALLMAAFFTLKEKLGPVLMLMILLVVNLCCHV